MMSGTQAQGQPSPKDLLVLESSTFRLSHNCFKICAKEEDFIESASLDGSQRENFDRNFNECMKGCVISYIQTRQYVRDSFMGKIDKTIKDNSAVYTQFP